MHWLNEEVLAPLFEVNARLVELMASKTHSSLLPLRLSDTGVRARLSRCPVLLVDAGRMVSSTKDDTPTAESIFSREAAVGLARMTLVLVWSMARTDGNAARVVLGLSVAELTRIGGLRLGDLDALAEDGGCSIRPRWIDRPELWQRLGAPLSGPWSSPLGAVALRAVQLLFWEWTQGAKC
jgi:hypothetical protein